MPRTWFVCMTIVAAFSSPLFAAPEATVLAPVPPTVLAIARTLGVDPKRDRVRFLPDIIRLTQTGSEERAALLDQVRRGEGDRLERTGETAVVPLDPRAWSTAVFKRPVSLEQLMTAILGDRRAALLAAGLATLDDETLAYIGQTPVLLSDLYERGASPFAAFAPGLHVHNGRVVTPGAEADRPIWESVVGAVTDAPDRFIRALYASPGGRLAYLYGTVAALDPARVRFVLGPTSVERGARTERLRALAALTATNYGEWKLEAFPYSRPLNDLAMLLVRLRVDDAGRPAAPADRAFWHDVWSTPTAAGSGAAVAARGVDGQIDAAWLTEATGAGNMYERGDRLEQLAFAQRVFGADVSAARGDAVAAVRAFPRQRMLLLTLERMGFRSPALFAFVSRQASGLDLHDVNRAYWIMAQLQPALALLSRMTAAGTLHRRNAEALVRSLFSIPVDEHQRYSGGVARWIARELAPLLPLASDLDTSALLALAGAPLGTRARRVEWEGEPYRLDFAAAELRRLQLVREKQGGPSLELATTLERVAASLATSGLDIDGVSLAQRALQNVLTVHAAGLQLSVTASEVASAGIVAPRRHRETLEKIAAEVGQAVRTQDVRRAARQAGPLHELVDIVLGQALLATAYAVDLGDPDGPALLTRTAALRHDFGFGRLDGDTRARTLWAVPRQDFQPGVAWHVTGSALGLDIALARLSLRRINSDQLSAVPHMPSIERDGFAIGLALIDSGDLRDETRDAIAAALAKGTARAAAAAADPVQLDPLADTLRLSAQRRRALRVMAMEAPERLPELLSLVELVQLGDGPSLSELTPWGVSALTMTGCPCTQVVTPAIWPLLTGRPQLPLAATAVPDLNIRIAAALAEFQLPAQLARPVLAAAIQDFLEDAAPSDGGDWWGLARAARTLTRERIEDYVAAVASIGGALIPDEGESKEP